MGAGAALAMETADVTLLDSNLEKLVYSIDMGKRVIRKIKENVIFSVAVKFLVLGFALAGKTHLWAAIGSDVGAMILVTLNSMSLLPRRQRREDVLTLKGDIEQGNYGHRNGLSQQKSSSTIEDSAPAETPLEKPSCEKACYSKKALFSEPMKTSSSCQKECCLKTIKIENSNGSEEGCCSKKPSNTEQEKTNSGCQPGSYSKTVMPEKTNSGHGGKKGCCSNKATALEPGKTASWSEKGCCSKSAEIPEGSNVDDGCEEGCRLLVEPTTALSGCQKNCSLKNTKAGESSVMSCESFSKPTGTSSTGGCCLKDDVASAERKDCFFQE